MKNKNFFHLKSKDLPDMKAIDDALVNLTLNNAYNVFAQNRSKMIKRLNAYDTELFEEIPAVKIGPGTAFNEKNKILELDNELKRIDDEIKFAEVRKDELAIKDLHIERYKIIQQIEKLKEVTAKSLNPDTPYAHLVSVVAGCMAKISNQHSKMDDYFQNKILAKLMGPFSKSKKLREILQTLNTLNQNVTELSNLRIPYGEQESKYEELAKYISQATSIQSLIKREINH